MSVPLFGEPKMALCRRCHAPLIATVVFPQFEFYCLECGWHGGYLSPDAATPTPELEARHAALRAEWDEHVVGEVIVPRSRLEDCPLCKRMSNGHREYHEEHTTEAEREADAKARAWLAGRIQVER